MTERKVDHIDPERRLVRGREIDGIDYVARHALPVLVERLQDDQARARRDACIKPFEYLPVLAMRPETWVPWP